MQNDYAHLEGAYGRTGADLSIVHAVIRNIKRLIESAHKAGTPVIFTRNWKDAWHTPRHALHSPSTSDHDIGANGVANTWGADWYEVKPTEDDVVISKQRYDAFVATDLDQVLRAQEIRTLIFTGIQTNVCVESTARSAFMKDFSVIVVDDATATTSQ